jgi:transposase
VGTLSTGCRRPKLRTCAVSCGGTLRPDGIDAETLARMPLADPGGLQQLELPGAPAAALDRRVRACARLTQAAAEHKTRIKDLVRAADAGDPADRDLGKADLAVLEHYGDPRALLAAGEAELTRLISTTSGKQQGHERARQWRDAAAAAVELYDDHPAVPYGELAAEVASEVRLLRAIQAELAAHATAREQHYLHVDPDQLARSLPGFAEISAPVLIAAMGRPGRFRDGTRFKSYVGLAPRASETGETDRKGQPMSKAGPSLLRATFGPRRRHRPQARSPAREDLLRADDRARGHPPQGLLRRRRAPRRTGLDRTPPAAPRM